MPRVLGCIVFLALCVPSAHAQNPQPRRQQASPQTATPQRVGPQAAALPRAQQSGALAPEWLPLPAAHQKYLDEVLQFWEFSTSKVQRYRTTFKRWEYEPTANKDVELRRYSEGAIKYAAPDKGLFRVEKSKRLKAAAQQGAPQEWDDSADAFREHWVCDGKAVWEFDYHNEQLVRRELPPEMQGKQIAEGPLPFIFGAKADRIKSRFWLRVITPKDRTNEYWLEAVPKTRDDMANFRKLHIIIAEKDFLPKGMIVFHPNLSQTTYAFEKRETNWSSLPEQLNIFHREFYEPKTPSGWKKIEVPAGPPAQARRAPGPQTRQGIRVATPPRSSQVAPVPRRR